MSTGSRDPASANHSSPGHVSVHGPPGQPAHQRVLSELGAVLGEGGGVVTAHDDLGAVAGAAVQRQPRLLSSAV